MAITRSQIARQLLAEGGVSLNDAKRMAPEGEFLAYINPKEANMLKQAGGSGIMTPMGIPSFVEYGGAEATAGAAASQDQVDSFSGGDGDGGGGLSQTPGPKGPPKPGDGGSGQYITKNPYGKPITNLGRRTASFITGLIDPIAGYTVNQQLKEEQQKQKDLQKAISGAQQYFGALPSSLTTAYKQTTGMKTGPSGPPSDGGDGGLPIIPRISPQVAKIPTDIEPKKSDMRDLEEFQQRFILPERFRLAEGGDVSVKDAEKMAPKGEFLAYINDDEAALLKSLGGAGKAVNETGIPSFFVKKLFKKAAKAVKKVVKSPIGKAALAGAAVYGLGGGFGPGGFAFSKLPGAGFFTAAGNPAAQKAKGSLFSRLVGKIPGGKVTAGILGASALGGLAAGAGGEDDESLDDVVGRISDQTGIDVQQIRKEVQDAYAKGDLSSLASKYPFLVPTGSAMAEGGIARLGYAEGTNEAMQKQAEEAMKEGFPKYLDEEGNEISLEKFLKDAAEADKKMVMPKKKPAKEVQKRKEKNFKKIKPALEKESADMVEDLIRSKKAGGGLMDLGGTEMDLRGGGFVPIGAKEKADDVPARLSKNEFVFTADAVRAAGGGSVEKGAQKMYNTMKQLEDSIA